jgi:hypothetical protein
MKRWCPSCVILFAVAAMLFASLAMFGNPRHSATAAADVAAATAAQTGADAPVAVVPSTAARE